MAVQAHGVDHFARLGVARSPRLDAAELEQQYLERSRQVHPDLAGGDGQAIVEAAALNDAFRVLRDRWQRYAYLAELLAPGVMEATKTMCPMFLAEAMDLFEAAQAAHTDDAAADQLRARVEHKLDAHASRIEALLATPAGAQEAATLLHQARYLERVVETLDLAELP